MESSYPLSAHSALGFAADVMSHKGDSRESASRSVLGLVAPGNGRLSVSPGSRSVARMLTGEVFLTRSRLDERPPDPEFPDDVTIVPPIKPPPAVIAVSLLSSSTELLTRIKICI